MRSSAAKIKLTSVDDLFSSEESRADASRERVVELPLAEMHPFKNHPFKVLDLLTTLYNATATMKSYYDAAVRHDHPYLFCKED